MLTTLVSEFSTLPQQDVFNTDFIVFMDDAYLFSTFMNQFHRFCIICSVWPLNSLLSLFFKLLFLFLSLAS